jgi:biopolymer transport protein ExbD
MRINLGEDEQPEIGLIALIDCIFFLLMFFMLATSFKQQTSSQKQKELSVVLPGATASFDAGASRAHSINIGIDRVGNLYWDGQETSIQKLHDLLRAEGEKDKEQHVRIDGDQMTEYKNIVKVIDLCQFEGLTNVSLHTRNN